MVRLILTLLAGAVLWTLLWLPVRDGLQDIEAAFSALDAALAALGITLLAWAGFSLGGRAWSLFWLIPLLVLLIVIRFTWYGLIQFTGMGFTVEFFIHLEWESIRIAWQEYGRLARRAIIAVGLLVLVAAALGRYIRALPSRLAWAGLIAGLVLVVLFREGMPERQLYQAWGKWSGAAAVEVDPEVLQRWQDSGLVETAIRDKRRVSATPPDKPRNLIVLYLESVGVNLADREDWPDLMPRFTELLADHAWVDHVQTSSYITIEGLTNTLCGTLFPYLRGSDSLAGGGGLAERLPCMGDVLSKAGYHQVYLGGAGMSFAGKGRFLAAHGFDELKGMEYWREQGLRARAGKWGLSDTELFEQSLEEMERLREGDDPFNITLLNIGSHLPGYFYRECEAYPHGEAKFLQALHCTDQLLGQWVDAVRESGALEDTVVVITADHHVFPNPDMRELFGDDVEDRRLPFIVLGPDLPRPAVNSGAGYDMAPTVLDLLEIEHDASFILGRSLVEDPVRPDYLVKRYRDVHEGRVVNPSGRCDDPESVDEIEFPLGACERQELFAVLEEISRSFSAEIPVLDCSREDNRVRIAAEPGEPVSIYLGGAEQASRHAWRSREIDPAEPGLFLTEIDHSGEIHLRRFVPEGELSGDKAGELVDDLPAEAYKWLVAWNPEQTGQSIELPGWQIRLEADEPAAWLIDSESGRPVVVSESDESGSRVLWIGPEDCYRAFDQQRSGP